MRLMSASASGNYKLFLTGLLASGSLNAAQREVLVRFRKDHRVCVTCAGGPALTCQSRVCVCRSGQITEEVHQATLQELGVAESALQVCALWAGGTHRAY
jgi:hypothetical protein